jgi:hypothetical protein
MNRITDVWPRGEESKMVKMKNLVWSCGLLVAFGCSCSGGSSPIAFEDFCTEYAKITCRAADKCKCLEGIGTALCETYQRQECASDFEEPVLSGRQSYDDAEAGRCLSAIDTIIDDCSLDGDDWPESCDRMLVGLVEENQNCEDDDECKPGLECYEGVCTRMPVDGQPCLDATSCADDHFCGEDGLCHQERGAGQDCPEGDMACRDDLYCDPRDDTCRDPIGAGQDCAHAEYACVEDHYCSEVERKCTPDPGEGQDCSDPHAYCRDGLYCDAGGTCRDLLDGGADCTEDKQCKSDDCSEGKCVGDSDCPFL